MADENTPLNADPGETQPVSGDPEKKPASKRKVFNKALLTFAAFCFGFIFGSFIVFFITRESVKFPEVARAPEVIVDEGSSCKVSVIGSGWGGVYFAYRLAVDSTWSASDICIFEANSKRTGGRTYSYPIPEMEELIVELGASRFRQDQIFISDLLQKNLGFSVGCFDCQNPLEENSRILVDQNGNNIGFSSGIEAMLQLFYNRGGNQIYFGHKLVKIASQASSDGPLRVIFENGHAFTTQKIFLNLPTSALNNLDPNSLLYSSAPSASLDAFQIPSSTDSGIVYLVYEDAWWFTKLKKTSGEFYSREQPQIRGSYGQSQLVCINATSCKGALVVLNSKNRIELDYYKQFHTNEVEPLASFTESTNSDLRRELHNSLMEMHRAELEAAGYDPDRLDLPFVGKMGLWYENDAQRGYPGVHFFPRDTPDFTDAILKPLENYDVFIANEAWSASVWAEGSLLLAERILEQYFGLPPPPWANSTYLAEHI